MLTSTLPTHSSSINDSELVLRLRNSQNVDAFQMILNRYGSLVWNVCRRSVHTTASAEDAFQATFLVLLRQCGKLQLDGSLGSWLYGVARRIASRQRHQDNRSYSACLPDTPSSQTSVLEELTLRELQHVIDDEIDRLPSRYRSVMRLCLFGDFSFQRAATQLQQQVGMVRGCYYRGRRLLQDRLMQRGIATVSLATITIATGSANAVPLQLLATTKLLLQQSPTSRVLALATGIKASASVAPYLLIGLFCLLGTGGWLAAQWGYLSVDSVKATFNSIMTMGRQLENTGYVDDHLGRPVAHAKVEVYRMVTFTQRKLDTTITSDELGRFTIPEGWREEGKRILLVRDGEKALGWSDAISNPYQINKEIRICVLPLTAVIHGKLIDETKLPVKQATVLPFHTSHPLNGSINLSNLPIDELNILRTKSDDQGRFELRVPIQSSGLIFPYSEKHISRRMQFSSKDAGECDVGTVTLAPGASIQGLVRDPSGMPCGGVHIFVQQNHLHTKRGFEHFDGDYAEATTDQAGRFLLSGLSPDVHLNLLVDPFLAPGQTVPWLFPAKEDVTVQLEKPVSLDIKLQPGKAITGVVVDAVSKKPLSQIDVGYYGTIRPRSSSACQGDITDKLGRFRIWTTPGFAYLYLRTGPGQGEWNITVPDQGELPALTLESSKSTAPPGYMGDGVVMGSVKQFVPAAGSKVAAEVFKGFAEQWGSSTQYQQRISAVTTDDKPIKKMIVRVYLDGKLLPTSETGTVPMMQLEHVIDSDHHLLMLPHVQDRKYGIEVDVAGYERQTIIHTVQSTNAPVEFKLKPAVLMPTRCKVIDTNGKPVQGARIQLFLQLPSKETSNIIGPELRTDEQGMLTMNQLRQGESYRLRLLSPGMEILLTDWFTPQAEIKPRVFTMLSAQQTPK